MSEAVSMKAGRMRRRAGDFVVATGLILGGLPLAAFADGGTLRLSETEGPYRISVMTSSNPFRAGPVDVSVIVADALFAVVFMKLDI